MKINLIKSIPYDSKLSDFPDAEITEKDGDILITILIKKGSQIEVIKKRGRKPGYSPKKDILSTFVLKTPTAEDGYYEANMGGLIQRSKNLKTVVKEILISNKLITTMNTDEEIIEIIYSRPDSPGRTEILAALNGGK